MRRRTFITSLLALPFVAKLLPQIKVEPKSTPNAQYVESWRADNPQYEFGWTGFKPASPTLPDDVRVLHAQALNYESMIRAHLHARRGNFQPDAMYCNGNMGKRVDALFKHHMPYSPYSPMYERIRFQGATLFIHPKMKDNEILFCNTQHLDKHYMHCLLVISDVGKLDAR